MIAVSNTVIDRTHHSASDHPGSRVPTLDAPSDAALGRSREGRLDSTSTSMSSHRASQPRHGLTVDPRFRANTTQKPPGSSLTEQVLTHHQSHMTHFQSEPGSASGHRKAQEERTAVAARTLGFSLPPVAAKRYDGMAPLERFKEEKKHHAGAWTSSGSRP